MKILELGCGNSKTKGAIGLDSSKLPGVDVVWDLEKTPLPFKDGEFDEVRAYHLLEHIHNFLLLMKEINRITRKGGKVHIKVPFYSAWGQFNDPTHVRFFTPFTFEYFKQGEYSHEVGEIRFDVESVKLNFGVGSSSKMNFLFNPLLNLSHKVYCRFFAWIFPAAEIEYILRVVK